MSEWQKSSWRSKPRVQMPDYTDADRLETVEAQLRRYPPLVFAGEARSLRSKLGAAARGEAFEIRVGDETIALEGDDVLIETHSAEGYSCEADSGYLAALDTSLNDELIAEGLARKIAEDDVPELLSGKRVVQLDLGAMVAGTRLPGVTSNSARAFRIWRIRSMSKPMSPSAW